MTKFPVYLFAVRALARASVVSDLHTAHALSAARSVTCRNKQHEASVDSFYDTSRGRSCTA